MKNFLLSLMAISISLFACNNMQNNMGGDKNMAADNQGMRDFYEKVMNAHSPDMVDSFVSSDYVEHQVDPHYPPTREGLKTSFRDLFAAYPDFHVKLNFVFEHGDTAIAQITITGTNTGSMMGMPPTNKAVNFDGVDIVRLVNGKAVEHWGYLEETKMMTQLGLMPSPPMMDSSKMKMDSTKMKM
jgi:predicted ester cyclase